MAEPQVAPRESQVEHLLDLTGPPLRDRDEDTDSYEEEWDDEEEDYDEYDTEDEESEEDEEEEEEDEEEDEEDCKKEGLVGIEESKNDKKNDAGTLSEKSRIVTRVGAKEEESDIYFKKGRDVTVSDIVDNDLLDLLEETESAEHKYEEQPKVDEEITKHQDTESSKIKDKIKRHIKREFGEDTTERFKIPLRPGIPFRNTEVTEEIEFVKTPKRKQRAKPKQSEKPIIDEDDFLSDLEDTETVPLRPSIPLRNPEVEEKTDFAPEPKRKLKAKPKHMEKPMIDEDEFLSDLEEFETIGSPYPEELTPVPEIGSERWAELMEQIMYKNPYEGYVPEETKEPAEAIWDRWERLDYQEGRYVDEEMFEDPYGPLNEGPITLKEIEELIERFKKGTGPVDYSSEKG